MNWIREKLKGWKTVLFGVAVAALGTWDALSASGFDITPFIPEAYRPIAISVIGLAVVTLRFVTSTPVGAKEPE